MIIKKIKLENIRSYESQEIDFLEGSTVLAGDIGSGKTSILLAIEFALFGLQPGQKGSGLLKNGKEEGKVTLEIEIDGQKIVIERGLKKSKSVNQSYSAIEIDGKKQEMSITELKTKVLELLNYPKEFAKKTNLLYRFTVYTPQEEMKQIILENSETRLDTLRHIFGIDKYKRIRENAETFASKLREQSREYEGEIKNLEEIKKKLDEKKFNIIVLEKSIENLKIEVEEKKSERKKIESEILEVDSKIKEKQKYDQEVEKTKIMLLGKKELISGIERERQDLMKKIEEIRKISFNPENINKFEEEIKEKDKEIDEKNKTYMEILSRINFLSSKVLELEQNKKQIAVLQNCPTCFQNVPEDYKSNISRKFDDDIFKSKKELESLKPEKQSHLSSIDLLKISQNSIKKQLDEFRFLKIKLENVKEKELKSEELEKSKLREEKDITLLEKQIESLKEYSSLLKKFDLIYEEKKKLLDEAFRNENKKKIELASTEKEKELSLVLIEEINQEIKNKETIQLKLIRIQELEDYLSTTFLNIVSFTEKNIMLKLREEFSKLFNDWFNILVPEIFTVRLDEDFTPIIEQQDYQLDYSFLSGGERTAIALAYRLALNQVINSMLSRIKTRDLVILDEPTDGFSEQQLDKMRDVLYQLKVKQLIIVSHEAKIESFVENIIKFKKVDGLTRVDK